MAKTLLNTRALVRGFLDEASASDWTDSELNILINQRYHRVYTQIVNVFEDYYSTTSTFNTVANQQEYGSTDSLPTDIYKLRRVEINYDVSNSNSSPLRALPLSNIDAVRRDLGQANIGARIFSSVYYYFRGHGSDAKLGFIPIPDKAGTNAVKMWYVKTLSDLSSDSSSLDIPYIDRYYNIIAEGATGDALRFGQQDSVEAEKFDAKFDRGLVLMKEELEDRMAEESKSVLDVSGEYLDFEGGSF